MNKLVTREELIDLIRSEKDVTQVNTSEITDMSYIFHNIKSFNQTI
jgi:hypothetical protein